MFFLWVVRVKYFIFFFTFNKNRNFQIPLQNFKNESNNLKWLIWIKLNIELPFSYFILHFTDIFKMNFWKSNLSANPKTSNWAKKERKGKVKRKKTEKESKEKEKMEN